MTCVFLVDDDFCLDNLDKEDLFHQHEVSHQLNRNLSQLDIKKRLKIACLRKIWNEDCLQFFFHLCFKTFE